MRMWVCIQIQPSCGNRKRNAGNSAAASLLLMFQLRCAYSSLDRERTPGLQLLLMLTHFKQRSI